MLLLPGSGFSRPPVRHAIQGFQLCGLTLVARAVSSRGRAWLANRRGRARDKVRLCISTLGLKFKTRPCAADFATVRPKPSFRQRRVGGHFARDRRPSRPPAGGALPSAHLRRLTALGQSSDGRGGAGRRNCLQFGQALAEELFDVRARGIVQRTGQRALKQVRGLGKLAGISMARGRADPVPTPPRGCGQSRPSAGRYAPPTTRPTATAAGPSRAFPSEQLRCLLWGETVCMAEVVRVAGCWLLVDGAVSTARDREAAPAPDAATDRQRPTPPRQAQDRTHSTGVLSLIGGHARVRSSATPASSCAAASGREPSCGRATERLG